MSVLGEQASEYYATYLLRHNSPAVCVSISIDGQGQLQHFYEFG